MRSPTSVSLCVAGRRADAREPLRAALDQATRLGAAYAKLGIGSRAELPVALAQAV